MASHGPFWIRGVRVVSGDHAEGWVELLAALGRDPDERLSSCGIVDGRFVARIRTVSEVSRLATADADRQYGTAPLHARVTSGRGTQRDAVGMRELFCDLDVKPGGMPSWDAVHEVIDTLGTMRRTERPLPGRSLIQDAWARERQLCTSALNCPFRMTFAR